MGFETYKGNTGVVSAIRRMLTSARVPHTLVLAGPEGVGKYTLATMVARAINCENDAVRAQGDFCGVCHNCKLLGQLESYEDRPEFAEILAERQKLALDERRDNPLLLSTHPDVFVLPPDGKTQQISVHQVRKMLALAQYRPARARQRVFILDHADRTDEVAANSMLKILEEPPADTLLLLTAVSYYDLLPTIRSRAIALHLAPISDDDVESLLADLPWPATEKKLAARLAEGSPGVARRTDLEESRRIRSELLALLKDGVERKNVSDLFAHAQSLSQAKQEKLEKLLALLYSLLHDILYLVSTGEKGGTRRSLRNLDLEKELGGIARHVDWEWVTRAARRLDRLDRLLRRNINKQVALEALAVSLGSAAERK